MKIICLEFHIKTPVTFEIYENFGYKHPETIEYVKN